MSSITPKLIFFDLETGGLNPARHPILQVAGIAVDAALEPIETFEAKIRFDERKANRNSLRKNHYHRGIWVRTALEPEEAARNFADFIRRHASIPMVASDGSNYLVTQLVAHNSSFDGEFLQAWYERLYLFLPARYQILCTMQRAIWYFAEHRDQPAPKDFKLATLCHYFGVPFHAASAHEALADVSATVALYRAMRERSLHLESSHKARANMPVELSNTREPSAMAGIGGSSTWPLSGSNGR